MTRVLSPPSALPPAPKDGWFQWAAIVDIDKLKRFNGHNGHLVGDVVIAHLGMQLRKPGEVWRSGGAEFTAFFTESSEAAVVQACERVRAWAEAELTPVQRSHCGDAGCLGPTALTISIGIAAVVDGEFRGRALQALYEAKSTGGNRVCVE